MSRIVHCRKYKQDLEGLVHPPMPGKKGLAIYEDVSQKAWSAWLSHQTLLINEKHLNLMDLTDRAYLSEQMDSFLSNESVDQADGYVPPSNT